MTRLQFLCVLYVCYQSNTQHLSCFQYYKVVQIHKSGKVGRYSIQHCIVKLQLKVRETLFMRHSAHLYCILQGGTAKLEHIYFV